MTFKFLLRDSIEWTLLFFVLVVLALFTQHTISRSVRSVIRGPVKAAPALFLAGLSWYLQGPALLSLAFLLCALGDILLDLAKTTTISWAFEAGAATFGAALICLSLMYLEKPLEGRPLVPLSIPNIVIALFVCLWVLPKIRKSLRIAAVSYLILLVVSNVIASTSLVPVFLGSTLWLLSDMSIGISRHIPGSPATGMTNLGVYDLGLYFIALGFLNL